MLQNYENKQRRSSSSVEELANTLKNLVLESELKKHDYLCTHNLNVDKKSIFLTRFKI